MKQFWMVWNPAKAAPTFKHESERNARIEAERLARMCPGEQFFVLEAVEMRCVTDMQRVNLRGKSDDLPF